MNYFTPAIFSASFDISHTMHSLLEYGVNLTVAVLELVGLIVVICSALKTVSLWASHKHVARIYLEESLSLALTFLLAGEILRTIIVKNMEEILVVASIMLLRAALTFLIHWEIKNEKSEINNLHGDTKEIHETRREMMEMEKEKLSELE